MDGGLARFDGRNDIEIDGRSDPLKSQLVFNLYFNNNDPRKTGGLELNTRDAVLALDTPLKYGNADFVKGAVLDIKDYRVIAGASQKGYGLQSIGTIAGGGYNFTLERIGELTLAVNQGAQLNLGRDLLLAKNEPSGFHTLYINPANISSATLDNQPVELTVERGVLGFTLGDRRIDLGTSDLYPKHQGEVLSTDKGLIGELWRAANNSGSNIGLELKDSKYTLLPEHDGGKSFIGLPLYINQSKGLSTQTNIFEGAEIHFQAGATNPMVLGGEKLLSVNPRKESSPLLWTAIFTDEGRIFPYHINPTYKIDKEFTVKYEKTYGPQDELKHNYSGFMNFASSGNKDSYNRFMEGKINTPWDKDKHLIFGDILLTSTLEGQSGSARWQGKEGTTEVLGDGNFKLLFSGKVITISPHLEAKGGSPSKLMLGKGTEVEIAPISRGSDFNLASGIFGVLASPTQQGNLIFDANSPIYSPGAIWATPEFKSGDKATGVHFAPDMWIGHTSGQKGFLLIGEGLKLFGDAAFIRSNGSREAITLFRTKDATLENISTLSSSELAEATKYSSRWLSGVPQQQRFVLARKQEEAQGRQYQQQVGSNKEQRPGAGFVIEKRIIKKGDEEKPGGVSMEMEIKEEDLKPVTPEEAAKMQEWKKRVLESRDPKSPSWTIPLAPSKKNSPEDKLVGTDAEEYPIKRTFDMAALEQRLLTAEPAVSEAKEPSDKNSASVWSRLWSNDDPAHTRITDLSTKPADKADLAQTQQEQPKVTLLDRLFASSDSVEMQSSSINEPSQPSAVNPLISYAANMGSQETASSLWKQGTDGH